MKELKQIIEAYTVAACKQQRAALATVVHVEGSSYRGPGARMLITEEGILTGAISGGCLEGDALRKALMVMIEGKPLLTTYDTSNEEDAIIGVGLGCNGIIRVLIEPIHTALAINPIALLKIIVEKRQAAMLVTFFSQENTRSTQQGTRLLMRADGGLWGDAGSADVKSIFTDIKKALRVHETSFKIMSANGQTDSPLMAFMEYMAPPISLFIAGAGNDVFPLVEIAGVLGWDITLIDGRANYANRQRFPSCHIVISEPEEAWRNIAIDKSTAVVLMSHNYLYDKLMMKTALALAAPYVGMLGPRKKWQRMLKELEDEGITFDEKEIACVHSPIGLDIGAETPDEIALAIATEIKAVFAGRTGKFLRNVAGSIHNREKTIV